MGPDKLLAAQSFLKSGARYSPTFTGRGLLDYGTVRLAEILSQTTLTDLDLRNNGIRNAGIIALAAALSHCPSIQKLNLSGNKFKDKGAQELCEGLRNCPSIKYLDLGFMKDASQLDLPDNLFGDRVMSMLSKILLTLELKTLKYDYNRMSVIGMKKLAAALRATSTLTYLSLDGNYLGNWGAAELAAVLPETNIVHLGISDNGIGDAGDLELARVLPNTILTSVDIYLNNIGPEGSAALEHVPRNRNNDPIVIDNQ